MTDISGLILLALAGGFVGTYAPLIKKLPRKTPSDRLKIAALSAVTGAMIAFMFMFRNESIQHNIYDETYIYIWTFWCSACATSAPTLIESFSSKLKQHIAF
tara:strand:- start:100 stop:405 length:306 start_codon:yes stop_codon:yes gene_type:complete